MDLLLRRSVSGEGIETVDHVLSGKALVLGSDAKSDFLLSGLPARIILRKLAGGGVQVQSKGRALRFGDKTSRKVKLKPGDEAEVYGLTLKVFDAPSGFDAGLEIAGDVSGSRLSTALLVGNINPWPIRSVSWVLALSVLLLLAVPLLFQQESLSPLRNLSGIPRDTLWSSGPLSATHRAAGLTEDCSSCHVEPFKMVADESCLSCHAQTHEHIDPAQFPALGMEQIRCASCHREHNEPEWLVSSDNQVCTDCHAAPELWRTAQATNPHAVGAFSEAEHPEFRLSAWQPVERDAVIGWELTRTRLPAAEIDDPSGLKFNHEVHMNPDKVSEADGDAALVCASCHTLRDDGEHFEAITMNGQCGACHTLSYDSFDPDIALPHGDTRAAFEAMEAHFIRVFTDPVMRAERARKKSRRLPGKRVAMASCEGDGVECGRDEAAREARYQFADAGCVTCHQVTDTGASAAIDRWVIHPVKLTTDWYTQARFDHRSHLSLNDSSGDATCLTCHAASESTTARDVLMPGRDNCLACHSEAAQRAPAECIACHSLHRSTSPVVAITRRGETP